MRRSHACGESIGGIQVRKRAIELERKILHYKTVSKVPGSSKYSVLGNLAHYLMVLRYLPKRVKILQTQYSY